MERPKNNYEKTKLLLAATQLTTLGFIGVGAVAAEGLIQTKIQTDNQLADIDQQLMLPVCTGPLPPNRRVSQDQNGATFYIVPASAPMDVSPSTSQHQPCIPPNENARLNRQRTTTQENLNTTINFNGVILLGAAAGLVTLICLDAKLTRRIQKR